MLARQLKLLFACLVATVIAANPASAQILLGTNGAYSGNSTDITGLLLGNGSTLSAYGGATCTNQFPRSTNASGAWTCASITATDLGTTLVPQFAGLKLANGTAAAPGLAFPGGTTAWDTGIFGVTAGGDQIGFTIYGASRMRLGTERLVVGWSGKFGATDSVPENGAKVIWEYAGVGQWKLTGNVNGWGTGYKHLTELTTITAGASTATAIQIPANVHVLGVSVYVVTVIPTAATFTVTGTTSGTTFNTAAVSTAQGSSDVGNAPGIYRNGAAQTVTITPNLVPAAATGQVRVVIHYIDLTPATS